MMADEFDIKNPGRKRLSLKKMTKNLQISTKKLKVILNYISEKRAIIVLYEGKYVTLNCPRLKDICDNWTQKLLRSNFEGTKKPLPPKEEEEEGEAEKDLKDSCSGSKKTDPELVPGTDKKEKKKKPKVYKYSEDDMRLTLLLEKLIVINYPNHLEKTDVSLKNGANECRLMRERDKRKDIEVVLQWSQNDLFWKGNIKSMGTLREKYETLDERRLGKSPDKPKKEFDSGY